MTATGVPLSNVGSYCHCLTHVIAASISRGCPEITRISSTVPCAVRVASRTTIPLTRAFDASVGYIGGTTLIGRGSRTFPPTRTGSAGAVTFGGGGGGGGGAKTGGLALAFLARIPPRPPPSTPPGIPPPALRPLRQRALQPALR